MPLRRLEGPIDIREEKDDRTPSSLRLYLSFSLQIPFFFFCAVCIFLLTLSVPPSFTFSPCVITVIFPLTRSDYTQPPLAITFYFKSTQPPDLPRFRLLFGSAVVIKMLPGSSGLLSKVSFLPHHAIAIQHFSPAFPSPLPTHFLISPLPLVPSSLLIMCLLFRSVTRARSSFASIFLIPRHLQAVLITVELTLQGII